MSLIDKLIERQGGRHDAEFAAELGVGRSSWNHIRLRRRHMGVRTIHKVLSRYPSLRDEAMDYLASLPRRRGAEDAR